MVEPNTLNSADKVKEVYEMLRCLEVPLSTKDSELDSSQFAIHLEYEALRDVQGVLPISPGLLDEMEEHLCKDPATPWTHCHHAPSFSYLMKKLLPDKIGFEYFWAMTVKARIALWIQTQAVRFGNEMDSEKAGYDSRQAFSPLPAVCIRERFGLNFVPFTEVRLRAKR